MYTALVAGLIQNLQSVQNCSAQLITGAKRCDHIMHVLCSVSEMTYNVSIATLNHTQTSICCVSCTGLLSVVSDVHCHMSVAQSLSGLTAEYLADDVNLVTDNRIQYNTIQYNTWLV